MAIVCAARDFTIERAAGAKLHPAARLVRGPATWENKPLCQIQSLDETFDLAFFLGFSAALIATFLVYWKMSDPISARWMMFLMGAVQLGPFAGFAIYLPELFPSRLRSTGISFCYNVGRFAAAAGSFFSAILTKEVFSGYLPPLPYRYSAMTMCAIFLVGIVAVVFAPETKGQPLPEDDEGAR
jgi:hypothetical protein